jgi:hypothetical protein
LDYAQVLEPVMRPPLVNVSSGEMVTVEAFWPTV